MGSLIKIVDRKVAPVFFNKRPIVTLPQVDDFHGRAQGTAKRNFRANREHFIEGEDFFEATYEEWNQLFGGTNFVPPKRAIGTTNFVVPKTKGGHRGSMILLTLTGYMMLVKSLNDEKAWQIHRALVTAYFMKRQVKPPLTDDERDTIRIRFLAAEESIGEISRSVGRARSTVQRVTSDLRAARAGQMSLFS